MKLPYKFASPAINSLIYSGTAQKFMLVKADLFSWKDNVIADVSCSSVETFFCRPEDSFKGRKVFFHSSSTISNRHTSETAF